ncbi:MAG: DUF5679 domain-containing protein [Candidatus Pacearchaeota archaeon]
MVVGYCVRCKEKKEIKDCEIRQTSRKGYIATGNCSICGTKMSAVVSKDKVEEILKSGARKAF